MTYRTIWRKARAGRYPLSLRGWVMALGDLIDATPGMDLALGRGQFRPGAML
jgi:hypothetical protein